MSLKLFIIIAIILGAIILLYKELTSFRDDMIKHIDKSTNTLKLTIQNDMNVFSNKIKLSNAENIQLVRKMNMLERQPITNHFTETETDQYTDIRYLSDAKKENSFYMSNEDDHKFASKTETDLINHFKQLGFDIGLMDNSPLFVQTSFIPTTKIVEIHDQPNESPKPELQPQKEPEPETLEKPKQEQSKQEEPKQEQPTHEEPKQEQPKQEEPKQEQPDDSKNKQMESKRDPGLKPISDDYNSIYENITIGSLKGKKGENTKMELSKTKHFEDDVSTTTMDFSTMNLSTLKSMDEYNLNGLKKMAKCFNIPVSLKIDGKWKSLNKNDLYSKISEYLQDKKSH